MIAGFGLLLVKAWVPVLAATDPALAALHALPLAEFLPGLGRTVSAWGPTVGFGLALFAIRLATRSLLWPLLLAVFAVGLWNLLALHSGLVPTGRASSGPGGLTEVPARHARP